MRLTCPSCAAEYEIDESVIGRTGRMVRCASCAMEWFQNAPTPALGPSLGDAAAALEAAAQRAREQVLAPEPRRAAPEPEPRTIAGFAAREPDVYVDEEAPRPRPDPVIVEEPPRARREAPDPSALAASLRQEEPEGPSAGGAFLAGFATVSFLALALLAIYVKSPELAELAPAAKAPLAAYAALVDDGRAALGQIAAGLR